MTTVTFDTHYDLKHTRFKDVKEMYDYMLDEGIITEMGLLNETELSEETKRLFEASKKNKKRRINII